MPNTNCLVGWKCPACGADDRFTVVMTCVATLTDDGTEDEAEFDYNDDSYAACRACAFTGTVADFQTEEDDEVPNDVRRMTLDQLRAAALFPGNREAVNAELARRGDG